MTIDEDAGPSPPSRIMCKTCKTEKDSECFERTPSNTYRKECKVCRADRRKKRAQEAQNNINPSECALPSSHRCIECNRSIIQGARFTLRKDSVSVQYRGKCVDCMTKWHDDNRVHLIEYNAKRRNIFFDESKRCEFEDIVKLPCHYCDENDRVSGLDRLNSSLGYTIENVVPCCMICNLIKGKTCYEQFLVDVECIVQKNKNTIHELIRNGHPYSMNTNFARGRAIKRDKTCTLDNEEKNKIMSSPCYICEKTPSNGIDRFDSDLPYTLDNSKPCCLRCNMMKKDFQYDDFLYHCHRIYEKSKKRHSNE